MGDWEDIFGEGVAAESVIDSINRSNRQARRERDQEEQEWEPLPGSVHIRNGSDWQALLDSGCTAIKGDLMIEAPELTHLPGNASIVTIGGSLRLSNASRLTSLSLPALSSVHGKLNIVGTALTSLSLPALTSVGELNVIGTVLTSLSLPELAGVPILVIRENSGLRSVSLPALAIMEKVECIDENALSGFGPLYVQIGGLSICDNPALRSVSLPALASAWVLEISNNPALTSLSLPELAILQADRYMDDDGQHELIGRLSICDNAALKSVSLPALAMAQVKLEISNNPALTSLDLPSLGKMGSLKVSGAPLTSLDLPLLTEMDDLELSGTALTSLSLPALTTVDGHLIVKNNLALTNLSLPALTTLTTGSGGVDVRDNAALPESQVVSLRDRFGLRLENFDALLKRDVGALDQLCHLVADDRAKLEAHHKAPSMWGAYAPGLPLPELERLMVFAALAKDESTFHLAVDHLVAKDYCSMKRQKWSGVSEDDLGSPATPEKFGERLVENVLRYLHEVRPDLEPGVAAILTRFRSGRAEEKRTPAEELRAKWAEEMEEFKRMTWAAQRGYKRSSDGHPDGDDMDLYDQEAKECERLGAVLSAVVLPPGATPEAARELAFKALAASRTPANAEGGRLSRQYAWAQAVIDGDAKMHWNSYHPRWKRPR